MNYCSIDEEQKKHLLKLVDFLYCEVCSAGGDGDSLWYSRFYNVKDLLPIIEEYNDKLKFKWKIDTDDKNIYWGEHQEGMIITNDEEKFNNSPEWIQCKIRY